MEEVMMTENQKRYVGLDTHKQYVMVGAVNRTQEMILPPRKVSLAEFEAWAKKHLRPTDEVVLEATSNAWYFYDLLEPLVARVVVGHPPHIKLIAAALVKTDKKDTMTLAKLLAVNLIPPVWVPPQHVRELRALISHRQRLISQQTRIKNRLRSLLQRQHIGPTGGTVFSQANRAWWLKLDLSSSEKLRMRQDLLMLDHLSPLIQEVETEIERLSLAEPWVEQVPYLLQLPGIGLLTAMTVLSAIGDIRRFPSAKKLVGYAGLGAKVHSSGQTHRTGGITKPVLSLSKGKAARNCGLSWSKLPGLLFVTTSTGASNSRPSPFASVATRLSWLSLANSWSSSGTSCPPKSLTATPTPNRSPAFSSPGVANCGLKPPWVSRPANSPARCWIA
jgi:transposase